MDTSSEIAMLRQQLAEVQAELSRAREHIIMLEAQLDDIEQYGTNEINEAMKLRQLLTQAREETEHWRRVARPWKVNV